MVLKGKKLLVKLFIDPSYWQEKCYSWKRKSYLILLVHHKNPTASTVKLIQRMERTNVEFITSLFVDERRNSVHITLDLSFNVQNH